MNRDDIIRLAREAGLFHFYDSEGHCDGITDARLITEDEQRDDDRLVEMLAPFAALVAAAEREACAKVCDESESNLWDVYKGRSKDDQIGRGRGSEYVQGGSDTAGLLAAAIRARGEK